MANITTRYVTWISRGRRHHGSAYADIFNPTHSTQSAGETFQAPVAFPSASWTDGGGHQQTGIFAFWSVTGGVEGGQVSFPGDTPPTVTVGSSDIVATAFYIQSGGGPPGPPGMTIDAFDVNLGNFVDDDFVSVSPDGSLTAAANNDGFVPSASAESIVAYGSIHSVPFDHWQKISGPETVSNTNLNFSAGADGIAFAFYKTPVHSSVGKPGDNHEIWNWVSYGVMVDGGGPTGNGPVPPWNPYILELAAGLALAATADKVNARLKTQVMDIAAKQVSLAAQSIANKMVAGKKAVASEKAILS